MPIISLLTAVRINEGYNFTTYLDSIINNANNLANLELIIKFDDDQDILNAVSTIEEYKAKGLSIKYIQTPRISGYKDLSYFYSQLMFLVSDGSKIIMVNSIDIKFVKKDFDKIIIDSSKKYEDEIFVIHPTKKLSLLSEVNDINKAFQLVEVFPCWSRKWLEIQGYFGYNSSSDGYTGLVEYFLFHDYGIDRRIDVSANKIIEESNCQPVGSDYWNGARRNAMELLISKELITFAKQAAKNIALNITTDVKQDDYVKYLKSACLNSYDEAMFLERRINQELLPEIARLKAIIEDYESRRLFKPANVDGISPANSNDSEMNILKKIERNIRSFRNEFMATLGFKKYAKKIKRL